MLSGPLVGNSKPQLRTNKPGTYFLFLDLYYGFAMLRNPLLDPRGTMSSNSSIARFYADHDFRHHRVLSQPSPGPLSPTISVTSKNEKREDMAVCDTSRCEILNSPESDQDGRHCISDTGS